MAKLSAYGQKWSAKQRKACNEQQENATEEKKRKAAVPAKHQEGKKSKNDIEHDEEELVESIEQENKKTPTTKPDAIVRLDPLVSSAGR